MFRPKTLFIIGAGSSKELLLPLGDELKGKIAHRLRLERPGMTKVFVDDETDKAAGSYITNADPADSPFMMMQRYRKAADVIARALPLAQSIDNLLNAHSGDVEVERLGKIGIAGAIIRAEHESALGNGYSHSNASFFSRKETAESWHVRLARLLFAGARKPDVDTLFENVTFVIFNYDRCLERFLYRAVKAYFDLGPTEAAVVVGRARFIHPYGQVGFLPWQEGTVQSAFGNVPGAGLAAVSEGIKTFSETADSSVRDEIAGAVREATTLIFMGFGFIDQNMELLRADADAKARADRRVFLTSCGISDSDVPMVLDRIRDVAGPFLGHHDYWAYVERGTCRDLMENHRFRITRADAAPR